MKLWAEFECVMSIDSDFVDSGKTNKIGRLNVEILAKGTCIR